MKRAVGKGLVLATLALAALSIAVAEQQKNVDLVEHTTAIDYQKKHEDADLAAWHKRVPQTDVVEVTSSRDGKKQRAIFYDSGAKARRPLLVVLHSWSADYEQNLDIPFAEFAIKNDWAFIHPDFRGPNLRPQATASELAIQDVIDAVTYVRNRAAVDARRIYLVGYSGGAMKALVLAGRYPELWGAVAAWGAIYDIADWYRFDHHDKKAYRKQIAASCGGKPRPGSRAEAECKERSPADQLGPAAGRVPILIAHGLRDRTVPIRHAIDAFNELAAPGDRLSGEQRAYIDEKGEIPRALQLTASPRDPTLASIFGKAEAPLRFERTSRTATLVLFDGGHDMVYNAALAWMGQHRAPTM